MRHPDVRLQQRKHSGSLPPLHQRLSRHSALDLLRGQSELKPLHPQITSPCRQQFRHSLRRRTPSPPPHRRPRPPHRFLRRGKEHTRNPRSSQIRHPPLQRRIRIRTRRPSRRSRPPPAPRPRPPPPSPSIPTSKPAPTHTSPPAIIATNSALIGTMPATSISTNPA